jgi:glyoxylase-like metal-dependent hydrolase (beta-lactamase superfamily II)
MYTRPNACHSRREFLTRLSTDVLLGAGILRCPAAWAQLLSPAATPGQFEIQKVAADVYFAMAQPWALDNSNAAIFVNSSDVLVVDAHSHPAAAAALIAQIKKEVTSKPVRWLVNTHFHWDHTQGNHAYLDTSTKVDIIASNATKQLMSQLLVPRLRAALDPTSPGPRGSQQVARQLGDLHERERKATSEVEKVPLQQRVAQLESFAAEMKDFEPSLPTVTFDKSHVIREKGYDLHLEFHGYGHTAGDVVVFCPQKRVIVTGDAYHPGFPGFIDSCPQLWPKTLDSIASLQFDQILPGHGRMQRDRRDWIGQRNYIEELTERVLTGKKAGQSVADLQRTITTESLKSLHAEAFVPASTLEAVERGIKNSIDNVYDRVEKVSFTGTEPVRLRK